MVNSRNKKTCKVSAAPPRAAEQAAEAVKTLTHRPPPPEGAEILWDERQAAAALTLKPSTLNFWRSQHRGNPDYALPYIKIGAAIRYRKSDVEKFIADRLVTR